MRASLAATLAACALWSCGGGRAEGLRVSAVVADRGTGTIREIDVAPVPDGAPDYYVVDEGMGTFWRGVVRDRRVELRPRDAAYDIGVGGTLAVMAIDRRSGTFAVTPPFRAERERPGGFLNANFAAWHGDGTMAPATWWFDGPEDAALSRERRGSARVARIVLARSVAGMWNTAALTQNVEPGAARFDVDVRTAASCDGDTSAPRHLSGVTLYDRSGHVLTFCLSRRVRRTTVRVISGGVQAIVVEPARSGTWQTLRVDPRPYAARISFDMEAGPVRAAFGIKTNPSPGEPPPEPIAFTALRPV